MSIPPLAVFLILQQQLPSTYPWDEYRIEGYEVVDRRLIARTTSPGAYATVLTVRHSKLPTQRFVFKTTVSGRTSSVAWLEMLVVRKDQTGVTVRTKDTGGPMAAFRGEFRDRSIELPFVPDPANPPLVITISLVSDGDAEIKLTPFVIEEWPRWSLTWMAAGGFGAALGVVLGLLGGVYGLLAAIPALRPAAVRFGRISAGAGFLMFLSAPILYLTFWPFGIWSSLGVGGALTMLAFLGTLPMVRRALEDSLRRRAAADPALEPS